LFTTGTAALFTEEISPCSESWFISAYINLPVFAVSQ